MQLDTHYRKLQGGSKKKKQRILNIPPESTEKYGWNIGDRLKIQETDTGILITKDKVPDTPASVKIETKSEELDEEDIIV